MISYFSFMILFIENTKLTHVYSIQFINLLCLVLSLCFFLSFLVSSFSCHFGLFIIVSDYSYYSIVLIVIIIFFFIFSFFFVEKMRVFLSGTEQSARFKEIENGKNPRKPLKPHRKHTGFHHYYRKLLREKMTMMTIFLWFWTMMKTWTKACLLYARLQWFTVKGA